MKSNNFSYYVSLLFIIFVTEKSYNTFQERNRPSQLHSNFSTVTNERSGSNWSSCCSYRSLEECCTVQTSKRVWLFSGFLFVKTAKSSFARYSNLWFILNMYVIAYVQVSRSELKIKFLTISECYLHTNNILPREFVETILTNIFLRIKINSRFSDLLDLNTNCPICVTKQSLWLLFRKEYVFVCF